MFSKEVFLRFQNNIGTHSYAAIIQLVETQNYSLTKIVYAALRQMEICEDVLNTGQTYTVATAEETVDITLENADAYLSQAYELFVGAVVYAKIHDTPGALQISTTELAKVDDEVINIFKERAELIPKSPSIARKVDKIEYKGW